LTAWLTEHVAGVERRHDRVHEQLLARCRAELIEPPTADRLTEIVRSALYQAEQALLALVADGRPKMTQHASTTTSSTSADTTLALDEISVRENVRDLTQSTSTRSRSRSSCAACSCR
jgi:hypothetical protein